MGYARVAGGSDVYFGGRAVYIARRASVVLHRGPIVAAERVPRHASNCSYATTDYFCDC